MPLDPDLLKTLARRDFQHAADSDEAREERISRFIAGELDESDELIARWIAEGEPTRDLTPAQVEALRQAPLTVKVAAMREGVSERTIYRWLKSGQLDGHRAGSDWRITSEALDARRIESKKPKPRPAQAKKRPRKKVAPKTSGREWPE